MYVPHFPPQESQIFVVVFSLLVGFWKTSKFVLKNFILNGLVKISSYSTTYICTFSVSIAGHFEYLKDVLTYTWLRVCGLMVKPFKCQLLH